MGNELRRWWVLVLRALGERLAETLGDLPPISDDEIDQLGRDCWLLCGDISRQSLLPCAPVPVRGFWHRADASDGHTRSLACRGGDARAPRGGRMDEAIGPFIIERVWDAADARHVCRVAWTAEQLRQIGHAIREDDQTFLTAIETALRRALEAALSPQRG
jgi:hypothetical protein